jgi:membrane protease subunit (stomatin/prohibitin family)
MVGGVIMEGTVTISLKDYDELREMKVDKNYYIKKAVKLVEILEKVEEFLKVEEIDTELISEITEVLEEWYG